MAEWIKYGKTWEAFCNEDLNKPGIIIFVEYVDYSQDGSPKAKDTFLVGDINPLAGACDDCKIFYEDAIVISYMAAIDMGGITKDGRE